MSGKTLAKNKPWCTCIPGKLDGFSKKGKVFWVHSCGKPTRLFLIKVLTNQTKANRIKVCSFFLFGSREITVKEDEYVLNCVDELKL